VNGLSLLLLIALAIGLVVAYRTGLARGARGDGRGTAPPGGSSTATATATPEAARGPDDAPARLAQAAALADDRHALFRALADARAETARYRQLVVDLENDAPPPLLDSPAAPDDLKLIVGIGPVLERMLQQLGVADAVKAKSERVADGASVMRRLLAGTSPRELGLGAMTEIALFADQGITLVGPLPASLQNYTTYVGLPWPGAPGADPARAQAVDALIRFLQGREARALFAAAGIAQAP
jgi:predicted flap endonuclease-1-like 5' DNA nuclease